MKLLEAKVFPNTAPGGNGGTTIHLTLAIKSEEDPVVALQAVADFFDTAMPGSKTVIKADCSSGAVTIDGEATVVDDPEPSKPKRRRKAKAAAPDEGEGAAPAKPKRRRRSKAKAEEPAGPTKEDVAKAASDAAETLGSAIAGDIIADYSDTGMLDDIPEDKREAFIKEVEFELSPGS